MRRFSSIAVQSLMAVLFTVISVLGLSSIIELNVLKQRETRLLKNGGGLADRRIANSLSYTLWNLNREETKRVVLDEINSVDVSRIQVFDEHGALYLGAVKQADGSIKLIDSTPSRSPELVSAPPPQYTFSEDIIHTTKKIGSVTLDVTDAHLQSELAKLRWGIAIKLLLLVVLLSVVLWIALHVLVVAPLSTLKSWVERLPGEKSPARLRFKRSPEIDALAEAFNSMSLELKDKNEELITEQASLREVNQQMQMEIEERLRAEEAVRLSERKFSKAFRSSPVALAVNSLTDATFTEVNEALIKFTGYSRDELIGRSTVELGLWADLDERERLFAELVVRGSIHNRELQFRSKRGQAIYSNYSGELIEIQGETCILSVLVDITDRRLAEESLKANEALLRLFIQHTPAAIAMFDNEMRYLQVSDRFLADYKLEKHAIIGKSHYEVFPDLPLRWKEVHRRILAGAVERCDEDRYTTSGGNVEWIQWESRPWRRANGEIGGLVLFTQVITERKRAEEALRALSARVHSAREEEGTRIAREIHDELGGALTGLKWDLETIDRSLNKAENGSGIPSVRKRINTMTHLIEATINTVRRISSDLRPGVLDDLGLVAAIEWQLQQFQSRTGLKCHWKSDLNEVELSRDRATVVFRIFQEILTNILRHSGATNLYVSISALNNHLEVEVKDDGRGITDSERVNPRSLGLLGMKERALLVGGEVNVSGAEGKGTTVLVRVPLG
jgi:PAS domain S-box-containing protein